MAPTHPGRVHLLDVMHLPDEGKLRTPAGDTAWCCGRFQAKRCYWASGGWSMMNRNATRRRLEEPRRHGVGKN